MLRGPIVHKRALFCAQLLPGLAVMQARNAACPNRVGERRVLVEPAMPLHGRIYNFQFYERHLFDLDVYVLFDVSDF